MKINRNKKILMLCFSIVTSFLINMSAVALEVKTHQAINRYIADEYSSAYGRMLHIHLKNNLGLTDGIITPAIKQVQKIRAVPAFSG